MKPVLYYTINKCSHYYMPGQMIGITAIEDNYRWYGVILETGLGATGFISHTEFRYDTEEQARKAIEHCKAIHSLRNPEIEATENRLRELKMASYERMMSALREAEISDA